MATSFVYGYQDFVILAKSYKVQLPALMATTT